PGDGRTRDGADSRVDCAHPERSRRRFGSRRGSGRRRRALQSVHPLRRL
ncbi:uncharacterized protein METZ01_LOCUS367021, partial [marine metagenome]